MIQARQFILGLMLGLLVGGPILSWAQSYSSGGGRTATAVLPGFTQLECAPGDTNAAPCYSWDTDEDSGLYRIGADSVGLAVGGSGEWEFLSRDFRWYGVGEEGATNFERLSQTYSGATYFFETEAGGTGNADRFIVIRGRGGVQLDEGAEGWFVNNTTGEWAPLTADGAGSDLGTADFEVNQLFLGASATSIQMGTGQDVRLGRGAANRLDLASGDSLNLVNGQITVQGTGPHSIGGASQTSTRLSLIGNFTGATNSTRLVEVSGTLTTASGGVAADALLISPQISTFAAGDTYSRISTVRFSEPQITLGGASTVTEAVTVLIADAPTEGTDNFALHVDAGVSRFDGRVEPGLAGLVDLGSATQEWATLFLGDGTTAIRLGAAQDVLLGRNAANILQLGTADSFVPQTADDAGADLGGTANEWNQLFLGDADCAIQMGTAQDLLLCRDAANIFAQRNGITSQTFRLYGTFTDSLNYERLGVFFDGSDQFVLEAQRAGTGGNRGITLRTEGSDNIVFAISGSNTWEVASGGSFRPFAADGDDLGGVSAEVRRLFLGDNTDSLNFGLGQEVTLGIEASAANVLITGSNDSIEIGERLDINEIAGGSTPTTSDLTADAEITMFTEGDCLVFAYNDAATMTFIKIALDGSDTTISHNTTDPTTGC